LRFAVRSSQFAVNPKETMAMKGKKSTTPTKNGTLRPWLVDVVVDNLR